MNLSSFFIDRPIFASVIALFITLLGAFAYPALPLAQYPEIAPPSVALVLPGFTIPGGFWSAVGGALIVSIVSWVGSWFIGPRGRVEIIRPRQD